MRRNMPNPLPVLLFGRLATNQGIGKALLRDAMIRAVNVSGDAGVLAILVHALSEHAKTILSFTGICGGVTFASNDLDDDFRDGSRNFDET